MRDLPDWAERCENMPIADHHHLTGTQSFMQDNGFDTVQASRELWPFLDLILVGTARPKFDKAPPLNGLDVWRRVVCPLAPKSVARRVDLHTDLPNPKPARKLSELMDAIESWEKLRDRYYEMGWQTVQSDEQSVILLKMLPPDTPATMVLALEECTDFDALEKNLEKQIDWFVDYPASGNPRVQLVDGQAPVEQQQDVPPLPLPLRKRSWA